MKKAILVAIIGAMTLGVNAGDWGKAPVIDKTPIEECYDVGGEISAGYMTDYIFNGVRYARHSVWADVNYTFDSLWAPVNVGVWALDGIKSWTNGASNDFTEIDLYASVELGTYAGFDASLGYTYYFYPNTSGARYGEIGLDIARSFGWVDFVIGTDYAHGGPGSGTGTKGWFHHAGISRAFGITDTVALELGAGLGYSDGYNTNGTRSSGWNHYYLTASLPIELNCRATLTPYIGYNGAPNTWVADGNLIGGQPGAQSDILHGGVSLSVSF